MNAWTIFLFIGLILIIILTWILLQTSWMKAFHEDDGTTFVLGCPMGVGCAYGSINVPPEQQILTPIKRHHHRTKCPLSSQMIPRKIHQTNERSQIPLNMNDAIRDIISMNPEYEHFYYNGDDRRRFLSQHFEPRVLNCYNKLIPGAYKADLFRYCVLYIEGGVYLDTGFMALKPLRKIIQPTDTFVSAKDRPLNSIYNAFICSTPQHPILREIIDVVLDRIEKEEYGSDSLYPTGPIAAGYGFKLAMSKYYGYSTDLVIGEQDYEHGIKLGQHIASNKCISGSINFYGEDIFYTKYPLYRSDMKWYCTVPSYVQLYPKRLVYSSTYQPDIPPGHRFQENCPGFIGLPNELSVNVPLDDRICCSVTKHRSALHRPEREQRIPKVIYQTHERDEIPVGMRSAMKSILEKNPTYEYFYYNAKERRTFIKQHFDPRTLKCYDALIPGAYQADLFRYCLLYVKGGVYLDAGFVAAESLSTVIQPRDTFVSAKDLPCGAIYNAFICATPHHPIIRETLDLVLERIEKQDYGENMHYPTGPFALGEGFTRVTGKQVDRAGRYLPEVQLLDFQAISTCVISSIKLGDRLIFQTKYPTYRLDATWYNLQPSYSKLWRERAVFK